MLQVVDILVFIVFSLWVAYLFWFAILSLFKPSQNVYLGQPRSIVILIPAYKEDGVIVECVKSCLSTNYPREMFDVVVISDRMQVATLERLRSFDIIILEVNFDNSTKAKALNFAMNRLEKKYDLSLVLDADNTINDQYLSQLNAQFRDRCHAFQTHRKAKNIEGSIAVLDAVSEEINNSIFRKGHINCNLSAALIGSGMAFRYDEFKDVMLQITAIGGFDKELEHRYLEAGLVIGYSDDIVVLDEKVSRNSDFGNQRRRWMSAQLHYLRRFFPNFFPALFKGNLDFADKIFQMMLPPRVLLLSLIFIISLIVSLISLSVAIKWWVIFGILIISLLISIPKELLNIKLLKSIIILPKLTILMALNLLKIKGANRTFIHTSHGK